MAQPLIKMNKHGDYSLVKVRKSKGPTKAEMQRDSYKRALEQILSGRECKDPASEILEATWATASAALGLG